MATQTTKECFHCKTVKPASEFHNNSASKDGLASWCKACVKAYRRPGKTVDKLPRRRRTPEFLAAREAWLYKGLMDGFIDANEARKIEAK